MWNKVILSKLIVICNCSRNFPLCANHSAFFFSSFFFHFQQQSHYHFSMLPPQHRQKQVQASFHPLRSHNNRSRHRVTLQQNAVQNFNSVLFLHNRDVTTGRWVLLPAQGPDPVLPVPGGPVQGPEVQRAVGEGQEEPAGGKAGDAILRAQAAGK